LRRDRDDAEAQAVGAVLVDQVERVGRVAQRLRHLAALLVADDAGEIDVVERNPLLDGRAGAHEFEAGHDHARDPEEDDVRAGHERARRVEIIDAGGLLLVGLGPAHGGKRPQPRGSPRVEHVFLLFPVVLVGGAFE